jgi:hypothetical protein
VYNHKDGPELLFLAQKEYVTYLKPTLGFAQSEFFGMPGFTNCIWMGQTECTKKLFCRKLGTHNLDVHFLKSTLHTFREILITACKGQVRGHHSDLADSTLIYYFFKC